MPGLPVRPLWEIEEMVMSFVSVRAPVMVAFSRRGWPAFVLAGLVVALMLLTAVAARGAVLAGGCQPGSGRDLAGRHLTSSQVSELAPGALRCANLTGADLSGLSLAQADLTGALLRQADLRHADLTQATLSWADLSGADLSGATMIQATARHAKMTGANLTGVDLTQADLTGARLSGANLSGTSFTQATLSGATFTGATGVPPWSRYLLIATGAFFALLVLGSVRRVTRAVRGQGYPVTAVRRPAVLIARGLVGTLLAVVGFHLFVGALVGQIASAAGPPVAQTCAGPLCTVGVAGGFPGLFIGLPILIFGFAIRAVRTRSSATVATAGPFIPPGQFGIPSGQFGAYQQPEPPGQFNPFPTGQ